MRPPLLPNALRHISHSRPSTRSLKHPYSTQNLSKLPPLRPPFPLPPIIPSTSSPSPSPSPTNKPRTIFSGIQPTGIPHIGNLLGALQQWVNLQNASREGDVLFFSVVDLHAITVRQEREQLSRWKREMLASLVAVGLDPGIESGRGVVSLFYQSEVAAHAELMWILSCTASMGYLSRMTQWKSKLSLGDDASPLEENSKSKLKLGLFSYPVLQAADVLVHRATHVPVGEDQSQHLEFARECVRNFNSAYGPHLVAPETILSPAKRVMALHDPNLKMSKSHSNEMSRIMINDTPEKILKKIMTAVTDSTNAVSYDPVNRRGVSNLIELLSHFDSQGRSPTELGEVHAGLGLKAFKTLVAEAIAEKLTPIRERYDILMRQDNGSYLDDVARVGAERARESSRETMHVVREAMGL